MSLFKLPDMQRRSWANPTVHYLTRPADLTNRLRKVVSVINSSVGIYAVISLLRSDCHHRCSFYCNNDCNYYSGIFPLIKRHNKNYQAFTVILYETDSAFYLLTVEGQRRLRHVTAYYLYYKEPNCSDRPCEKSWT